MNRMRAKTAEAGLELRIVESTQLSVTLTDDERKPATRPELGRRVGLGQLRRPVLRARGEFQMGSAKYHQFIERVARFGFPVRFLREVESGYTILPGPSSLVLPWFDVMLLEPSEFDSLGLMNARRVGAATGIMNIYHETTHAWLDMNEQRAEVAALIAQGRAHYQGAPVVRGDSADANRLFQEAIASYVGHRAAKYWEAIEATQNLEQRLKKHQRRPEFESADQRAFQQIPKRYDAAMSERVFGYQSRCSWCAQTPTSRLISGEMKRFADVTLLENKIPDQFLRSGSVHQKWRGLRAR